MLKSWTNMITATHVLSKIQEDYEFSFKSHNTGQYCEVFLNPTFSDLRGIDNKYIRVLIAKFRPDEVYVWDSDTALHQEVINYLNDKYSTSLYGASLREVFTNHPSIRSRIANLQEYLREQSKAK